MNITQNSMNMRNNFGYGNEFPMLNEMTWLMFNALLIVNTEALSLDMINIDV